MTVIVFIFFFLVLKETKVKKKIQRAYYIALTTKKIRWLRLGRTVKLWRSGNRELPLYFFVCFATSMYCFVIRIYYFYK